MSDRLDPRPGLPVSEHPAHAGWLAAEADRLLGFAERARLPAGGFGWLDDAGRPDPERPAVLMQCCRYTHCFALASLWGRPGAAELAEHGITSLAGAFYDETNGGWRSRLAPLSGSGLTAGDSPGGDDAKTAYEHAFVVLAASSASVAGVDGAAELLGEALAVVVERFCIDAEGLAVNEYSADWEVLDPYRGANANMHLVEALLAASDATGEPQWSGRAGRIAAVLIDSHARANDWRIPEHFDSSWHELRDYNAGSTKDIFRPYGFTPGHGLEWSRLLLQLRAVHPDPPPWLEEASRRLFRRAVADGWDNERGGFVYTVRADGQPVVAERLHWVLAEAIGAAASQHLAFGDRRAAELYETFWEFADRYMIDRQLGSWHHELDPENRPAHTMFDGKPDVYHALQATLVPRLSISGGLALPLRRLREDR